MTHRRTTTALLAISLLCGLPAAAEDAKPFTPVTDQMLENPDPADWLMWRRTLNSWGYSPLSQITAKNVSKLHMVWTRGMGPGSQEGTPLVHDGVMFLPNPVDYIQAMDAATGDIKWEYRRQWPDDITKVFPTPTPNRNLAIYGTSIISKSADDYIYALDTATGKLLWQTAFVDYQKNSAQGTAGPLTFKGKVVSTRGCEPRGGPDACVITAHDAKTGKELWRTYTIPRPGEPGYESWGDVPNDLRRHVGAWMVPSYDPDLDMLYVGTSVTSPAPKFMLGGNDKQYLYHNSTLAIDPNTGKIVWYYQYIVDHWDMDHPFERILVDTQVAPDPKQVSWINPRLKPGEQRKVITGIPGKTGIVYTLDRKTGEFLWARPTVKQNLVSDIDGATGKVTVNPATLFHKAGDRVFICPTSLGGKNWPAGAYSPLTNTMYFPLHNTCSFVTAIADKPSLDSLYAISGTPEIPEGTDKVGTVQAISVTNGDTVWKYEQRAGMMSLVATGSGLLFGGDDNGRFKAIDQKTGKVLWEVNLGSPVTGYPITYSVNNKQYVAVSTGFSINSAGVNRLTPELHPSNANNIFVFTLGD